MKAIFKQIDGEKRLTGFGNHIKDNSEQYELVDTSKSEIEQVLADNGMDTELDGENNLHVILQDGEIVFDDSYGGQ